MNMCGSKKLYAEHWSIGLAIVGCCLLIRCGGEQVLTGSVSGRVIDASTGFGISNATVSIGGISVGTSSEGYYSITNVPIGNQSITANAEGYLDSGVVHLEITIGINYLPNILLIPDTNAPPLAPMF